MAPIDRCVKLADRVKKTMQNRVRKAHGQLLAQIVRARRKQCKIGQTEGKGKAEQIGPFHIRNSLIMIKQ